MISFFVIDEKTQLPKPSPELLMVYEFKELMRCIRKCEGDADGRKKIQNLQEFAYIYYAYHYDSKYRVMSETERHDTLIKLLRLPPKWEPDEAFTEAAKVFIQMQVTDSLETVDNLRAGIKSLNKFLKKANEQLSTLDVTDSKTVNEYLNTMDRIPTTVENLKRAEAQLDREQDALAKGRGGRLINKFEFPDNGLG